MSRRVRRKTGEFIAKTASGEELTIHKYAEFHEGHTSSGFHSVEGVGELLTEDGDTLNYVSKGKYHIAALGLDLTSDDPNAP